ncbi:MAG: methionyl aminopeptidase [Actinomycetota bacterium]|nr:methionyl aminopeptidase [Actinomycetota bacterium]
MIYKKSAAELDTMRRGGKILGAALGKLGEEVAPGVTTAQLDRIFEEMVTDAGGKPSFKGYRGYPASICASPNEVIVHGIPNDRPLEEGDLISIDVGVLYDGFHTDTAWTFPVGQVDSEAARLLKITAESLEAAIAECRPGNRIGDVGYAVEQLALPAGFSLVQEYAGHGVGRSLHEEPWVPNYGPPGRREALAPGMTLAIEPMVNVGGAATKTLGDGWTVVTADGSLSAHFEHTVAITEDGHEVLTRRPGEAA